MESRYVRLEGGSGKPKKKAAGAVDHTLKLAIRLNEAINDALRELTRYRGDLSSMAIDALTTVDLEKAGLVSVEEKMVRDTTITIPRALHKKLKKISTDRETSMNILVNTALAHWLAQKGALKLR
jgi:hypothetical protein